MPLVFEWAQILFSMWVKESLTEPCLTQMIFHQGGQNVFLKPYYWTQEYLLEDFFYRKCSRLTQTNATHPSTHFLSPLILHSEWMGVLEPVPAVASCRWIAGPHRKTTNTKTANAKGSEWELNLQLSSTFRCSNSHLWPNSGCCCARDDLTITSTFSWKKSRRSVLTSSSLQCLHCNRSDHRALGRRSRCCSQASRLGPNRKLLHH